MFLHILSAKYLFLTPVFLFVVSAPTEIEVQDEKSSTAILDGFTDKVTEKIESPYKCLSAGLKVLPYADFSANKIVVAFELNDSKFRNCFSFFDISLVKEGGGVDMAKIAYNYNKEGASYAFENVSCGWYKVIIVPCWNRMRCSPISITYPKLLNMSSTDCNGNQPESAGLNLSKAISSNIQSEKLQTIFLILSVCSVMGILIVCGLLFYRYKSVLHPTKEDGIAAFRNSGDLPSCIKVFIINHYDEKTLKRVECLTSFISIIPNLKFEFIKDGLTVTSVVGINGWLNDKLERSTVGDEIRKIIVVDSMEEMEVEENENENGIFFDAIKKLGLNRKENLDDYVNLFVVHFGRSLTRLEEMKDLVTGVRHHIPDHAIRLCQDLVSGTEIDLRDVVGRLKKYSWDI